MRRCARQSLRFVVFRRAKRNTPKRQERRTLPAKLVAQSNRLNQFTSFTHSGVLSLSGRAASTRGRIARRVGGTGVGPGPAGSESDSRPRALSATPAAAKPFSVSRALLLGAAGQREGTRRGVVGIRSVPFLGAGAGGRFAGDAQPAVVGSLSTRSGATDSPQAQYQTEGLCTEFDEC